VNSAIICSILLRSATDFDESLQRRVGCLMRQKWFRQYMLIPGHCYELDVFAHVGINPQGVSKQQKSTSSIWQYGSKTIA
jgi:hypothetical protein